MRLGSVTFARPVALATRYPPLMGIHDRDWYRDQHRQQRQRRASPVPSFSLGKILSKAWIPAGWFYTGWLAHSWWPVFKAYIATLT